MRSFLAVLSPFTAAHAVVSFHEICLRIMCKLNTCLSIRYFYLLHFTPFVAAFSLVNDRCYQCKKLTINTKLRWYHNKHHI